MSDPAPPLSPASPASSASPALPQWTHHIATVGAMPAARGPAAQLAGFFGRVEAPEAQA